MVTEKSSLKKIQKEYKKVKHKTQFMIALADKLGKSRLTLKNHWFSSWWQIPEEYHEEVIRALKKAEKK